MFINPKSLSRTPNQSLPSILVNPYIIGFILSFINTPSHISAPIHISRHTFAVMMLDLGTDIYTLSKLLGHRDLSSTQVYAKILDKNKQAAVAKIPEIM